jgi:pyruvoyl-dependent arginine decarboxylase
MERQNFTTANPVLYVPKMVFFTKGRGVHKDYLTSFELALRDAEIADLNLVSVSSILPPRCKIVSRQEGRKHLQPGQIVFAIMARSATNEPYRLIAASIGLARPADESQYGYLSEHHSTGETRKRPVTMPRTWRWKCLQPHSGCQMIQALHGMKRRSSGGCQTRSIGHRTLPSPQRGIRTAFGIQLSAQPCLFSNFKANLC